MEEIAPKAKAILKKNKILVYSEDDIKEFSLRGYGDLQDGVLTLTFYETLYLLGKKIVKIEDINNGEIDFQNLLKIFQSVDENAWVKYLIYRDLRSRGYVVREGFGLGIDFRVYKRGEYGKETAKYLIFGIQEGRPVSMEELSQTLRYAQSLKKKLILAVLNRRGEVVYYSLSQLTLK